VRRNVSGAEFLVWTLVLVGALAALVLSAAV